MASTYKVGEVIKDAVLPGRDAIHVAVLPMYAGETLEPGEPVAPSYRGSFHAMGSFAEHAIGIVDPFLKRPLKAGEKFLVFMFPDTTHGLRHTWQSGTVEDERDDRAGDDGENECRDCN